jgi:hypothetical protein
VTAAVLDGGTDWGHPDLIGTWQTWSNAQAVDGGDAGWNGWPKAFDPFGAIQLLLAPDQIAQGLSWYTPTQARTCTGSGQSCSVTFATRTGPSRNSGVPAGTASHTYSFPREWTKSGSARLGSHPDDHSFADEKPITKSSPASYRDMDGDGYTDLSGGLLYYISDGQTTIPGGATVFGDDTKPAPGALLAWTGD